MPFNNNENSKEDANGGQAPGQSDGNNNKSNIHITRSTITTTASSTDSSKKDEEERNIKNLQVLFGALLQYDRFKNEKNFSSDANSRRPPAQTTTTTAPSTNPAATAVSHAPTTSKTKEVVDKKQQQEAESLESSASATTATTTNQKYAASAAAKSVAAFLCPSHQDMKETSLYQSTYLLLQWQRDNYMVGSDFANWRRDERVKEVREMMQQQQQQATAETARIKPTRTTTATYREMMQQLPHYNDAATIRQALGPIQLATIAQDFIPSTTMCQAALPLVVALPGSPALYPLTRQSLVALILGQQDNMNVIMKSAIISNVLQNPEYRHAMKKLTTKGYLMVSPNANNNNHGDIGMKSDGPSIS